MQPLVLTNAFLRPRATRFSSRVALSEDTSVYACVEEMISVIREDVGATPIMLPTEFDPEATREFLRNVDGIILPGAVSNIHPVAYGASIEKDQQVFDRGHDATDIFLIQQAKELGIPFLGICRAMQAMNVAFGGTLSQRIAPGGIDHSCSNPCDGHDDKPQYMHEANLEADGVLHKLFTGRRISVNSLHEQTIGRLGDGLLVEARAPDGVVEALSYPSPLFFLGVQWHPEALRTHEVSQTIFSAFRADVEKRKALRAKC